jgi:DNA-binding transcriptional regulator YiaG
MDLGLSQRKLAKVLGVDKKSVENWERRGIAPARWVAPKLNEFLGVQALEKIEDLGERLTACRRSLAISQERLAILIGVDRCTIARWETGATSPPKRFREKVKMFLERKSPKPVRSELE